MKDIGILEVNIGDNDDIVVPDYVSVLELVSDNDLYFNRNIARQNKKKMEKKHD